MEYHTPGPPRQRSRTIAPQAGVGRYCFRSRASGIFPCWLGRIFTHQAFKEAKKEIETRGYLFFVFSIALWHFSTGVQNFRHWKNLVSVRQFPLRPQHQNTWRTESWDWRRVAPASHGYQMFTQFQFHRHQTHHRQWWKVRQLHPQHPNQRCPWKDRAYRILGGLKAATGDVSLQLHTAGLP